MRAAAAVDRLCDLSRQAAVPLGAAIAWPAEFTDGWYTSAELVSLAGTDVFAALSEVEKRRLSRLEAVNFYSLNIAGERHLISGIAERLHTDVGESDYSKYLHYFLDEENKHLSYFAEGCARLGGKIYPHLSVAFPREYAPGEADFLFFAKILMFEEVVDHYNVALAADREIDPTVRQLNHLHHVDEVRHLAFGRLLIKDLFTRYAAGWSPETLAGIRANLSDFAEATWRQYYNPAVYADAGLPDPFRLADRAFASPQAVAHRRAIMTKRFGYLREAGLILEEGA